MNIPMGGISQNTVAMNGHVGAPAAGLTVLVIARVISVVTYFLDFIAGPDGLPFCRGDLVCLLDGRRLIVLVVVVYHGLDVLRGVGAEDVRRIHPRVLRVCFQD